MIKKIVDKWRIKHKDGHLLNLEELEKKLKKNKIVTNYFLIPIIVLSIAMFYYLFIEEHIIIGLAMGLTLFFVVQFQIVFYMISVVDDNNLKLFIALKQLNNNNDKEKNKE